MAKHNRKLSSKFLSFKVKDKTCIHGNLARQIGSMYIPGQELKYTLALHVFSFVLFYFACLVVCVCLSLSFLFLLSFSACVILQENSKAT